MATVLFVWELGGGLGHLMQMLPLVREFVRRGYRVVVVLRHLSTAAAEALCPLHVQVLQASHRAPAPAPFERTLGFAHVMGNEGFGDERELFLLADAWRALFAYVRPDAIVFDHSPMALLGSHCLSFPVKRFLLGSGFCVPPDDLVLGLPSFRVLSPPERGRLTADESRMLARANRLLKYFRQPPLDRLGQLFSQVDDAFLSTFEELEQYASRQGAPYWGPVLPEGGEAPQWPDGDGPAVFAYSKRFDGLEPLAAALRDCRRRTLLYVDGLTDAERRKLEGPTLRVTGKRVDLRRAAAECDAAVLHAGQGATAAVLLVGKPILQIPLVLEQRLTADATARLGAGEVVSDRAKDPAAAVQKLDLLLTDPRYATAARGFARKYERFDPAEQVQRMVARVEELMQRGRPFDKLTAGKERGRQGDKETRGQGARAKVFAG